MHTRRIAVGLLTAAALAAASTATATGMPMNQLPDPAPLMTLPLVQNAELLVEQLADDYAITHERRLHSAMVLVRHNPICAVL